MIVPGRARTRTLETFTIPEAAEALGKSLPNFRRWVQSELVPPPYLRESVRQHFCYCRGELAIFATILMEHEREYAYFCAKHEMTSHRLHQAIMGYRDTTFGLGALTRG